MVNADLMDAMDRALRQARGRRGEPFGGAQVVMFGDPYQLAPVPPRGRRGALHPRSLSVVLVLRREGLGRRDGGRRHHRRRLVRRRPAHPRARRHPPAGGSGLQGHAERRAPWPRDGGHRADPQRHRSADAAGSASTARRRSSPLRPATTSSTPSTAGTSTLCRAARRRRVAEISGDFGRGDAAYPADRELQLKVGRAGDVPAQRHRFVRRAAALGERHHRHRHPHRGRHCPGRRRRSGVRRRADGLGEIPLRVRRRVALAEPRDRRRVHAVPAAPRVGGHDPQVAGSDVRPRGDRPRFWRLRPGADVCGAVEADLARGPLPLETAAPQRHPSGPRCAEIHDAARRVGGA